MWHGHNQCLQLKMKVLQVGLYIYIFCILHIAFRPLNVDIAFGGQDAPKQP
jgi:hypothetical protein